jgi:hypothetical protein
MRLLKTQILWQDFMRQFSETPRIGSRQTKELFHGDPKNALHLTKQFTSIQLVAPMPSLRNTCLANYVLDGEQTLSFLTRTFTKMQSCWLRPLFSRFGLTDTAITMWSQTLFKKNVALLNIIHPIVEK